MLAQTSKRKTKSFSLFHFLFGEPFEFISPLSLDACVERLAAKSERGQGWFASKHKLLVKVSEYKKDQCRFRMERDAGRNLNVELNGLLERYEGDSTLVSGRARISPLFYVVVGIIFTVHVFVFATSMFPPFILLSAGAVIIMWVYCAIERNKLVRRVYNTLSDQIL